MDKNPLNMEFEVRLKHEVRIAYLARFQKFRMFFAGLIFAIISFIGTHPIITNSVIVKISEIISLFSLLLSGVILLLRASGITYMSTTSGRYFHCKNWIFNFVFNSEIYYWILFLLGMVLLIINRSVLIF